MIMMTVEEFRREVERRRGARRRGAPRYPDALVAFAVEHARTTRASGRSLKAAASDLGLSAMTLSAWQTRVGVGSRGQLREVMVRAASAKESSGSSDVQGLEVTTLSGHVVRGLSVADAAALLRALS